MAHFQHANARLMIGTKDHGRCPDVIAQYNPKEVQVDRAVPWQQHVTANNAAASVDVAPGDIYLEYTGAQGRTMTVELLFDGFEQKLPVDESLAALEAMATPHDPQSPDEKDRHPPLCLVSWGTRGVPTMRCVIDQLSVKYTMFDDNGRAMRAIATVRLREASKLGLADAAPGGRPRNAREARRAA